MNLTPEGQALYDILSSQDFCDFYTRDAFNDYIQGYFDCDSAENTKNNSDVARIINAYAKRIAEATL